jgi:hypothetical protein
MQHSFIFLPLVFSLSACGYRLALGPDGCSGGPTPEEAELTKSVWQ